MIFSAYGRLLCRKFATRSQFNFLDSFAARELSYADIVKRFKTMIKEVVEPCFQNVLLIIENGIRINFPMRELRN